MALRDVVTLLRPQQWVKNVFVFAPGFFAFRLGEGEVFAASLGGALAFGLVASSIYVLNDALDVEADRRHPEKCLRPLAAGTVSMREAAGAAAGCALAGFALGGFLGERVLELLLFYAILNGAYSLRLKHVPLVDVFCVATGFLLRIFVGGAATGIALSSWIIVMTFLLALFIALAKRRDDVLHAAAGRDVRAATAGYNLPLVDMALGVLASVTLVAYLMYTMAPEVGERFGGRPVYLTFPWVLLGILRYFQRTLVFQDSGSPTRIILSDRFLQGVLALWVLSFFFLGR
ncbi:MAG TPA: UbiA prenyltransferase family protein [Synergistaceae bacterium]|nr:UbiA prenyltransferase family protein [Synergistaceae bacterium]HQH78930.1 UbiA prenyltransferase family protein [Synergistaceae bacterium]